MNAGWRRRGFTGRNQEHSLLVPTWRSQWGAGPSACVVGGNGGQPGAVSLTDECVLRLQRPFTPGRGGQGDWTTSKPDGVWACALSRRRQAQCLGPSPVYLWFEVLSAAMNAPAISLSHVHSVLPASKPSWPTSASSIDKPMFANSLSSRALGSGGLSLNTHFLFFFKYMSLL